MEIGLIEIGLKQFLAHKICNYVDQIDKIMTFSMLSPGKNGRHISSFNNCTELFSQFREIQFHPFSSHSFFVVKETSLHLAFKIEFYRREKGWVEISCTFLKF